MRAPGRPGRGGSGGRGTRRTGQQRQHPGPDATATLLDYAPDALEEVYRTNTVAPLALVQAVHPMLKPGARVINVSSDAGVEAYAGWGGYGSSKAALEHLSAVLAVENPDLRIYWVDPGDMRTQMQQDAFPGDDIADRPLPEEASPASWNCWRATSPAGATRPAPSPREHDDDRNDASVLQPTAASRKNESKRSTTMIGATSLRARSAENEQRVGGARQAPLDRFRTFWRTSSCRPR